MKNQYGEMRASPGNWKRIGAIALAALISIGVGRANSPSSATQADKVTPQMEADFLAKFKAGMKNEDALAALFALRFDPVQAKELAKNFLSASTKAVGPHPNETFTFLAAPSPGKMHAVRALRLIQVPTESANSSPFRKCDCTLLLAVSNDGLVIVSFDLRADARDEVQQIHAEPIPATQGPTEPWRRFALLNDYKKAVEEAGVSVLDSGEVDRVFFVVGRAQADLCLFVQNRVGEQKGRKVQCTAVAGSKKLSIDLMGILSRARAQNLPMWLGPRFFYQIPANYRGDVAITVEYRTAKQLPLTFSRTVHWPG